MLLFNPDNGMAYPWSEKLAADRKDLVALSEEEARRVVSGVPLNEVLAARPQSVVEVKRETVAEEDEPLADMDVEVREHRTEPPVPCKGVVVDEGEEAFSLERFDAEIADDMLVSFAKDVLKYNKLREYEGDDEDTRDIYYRTMRDNVRRMLVSENARRQRKAQRKGKR